jgi:signal transduction histidine kinase
LLTISSEAVLAKSLAPLGLVNKLFTPLATTKSKGQGFGLSVVKRFTEGMGGTVTFESEVGKGTKFIIELPI